MSRTNFVIDSQEIPLCIRAPDVNMHRQYSNQPTWSLNVFKVRLGDKCKKLTPKQLDDGVDVVVDGVPVDCDDINILGRVTYHVYMDSIAQYKSLVANIIRIDKYKNPEEGGDQ